MYTMNQLYKSAIILQYFIIGLAVLSALRRQTGGPERVAAARLNFAHSDDDDECGGSPEESGRIDILC
jgi:hypothetical protein